MEKLVNERKELEILKDDIQKREELIQKMRTSQVLNKSLKSVNEKLKNVDKQQPNHQMIREQLLKQKRLFTDRLENLTPTEERRLIEIDEAIEAIDLAIDYQNNIISKREHDVQQSIRASQVRNQYCIPSFDLNVTMKNNFLFLFLGSRFSSIQNRSIN